jgi:hypothetical protein
MSEYVIFSGGEYINSIGRYSNYDYALILNDLQIAKWLADYFGGVAIDINDCLEYEAAYHRAVKEDVQSRLEKD